MRYKPKEYVYPEYPRPWFAWRPVVCDCGTWVWLEWVIDTGIYEYMDIIDGLCTYHVYTCQGEC